MNLIASHIKKFKELHNQIDELTKDNESKAKAITALSQELEKHYLQHKQLEKFTQEYCGTEWPYNNCDQCINQKIMDIIQIKNKYKKGGNK